MARYEVGTTARYPECTYRERRSDGRWYDSSGIVYGDDSYAAAQYVDFTPPGPPLEVGERLAAHRRYVDHDGDIWYNRDGSWYWEDNGRACRSVQYSADPRVISSDAIIGGFREIREPGSVEARCGPNTATAAESEAVEARAECTRLADEVERLRDILDELLDDMWHMAEAYKRRVKR